MIRPCDYVSYKDDEGRERTAKAVTGKYEAISGEPVIEIQVRVHGHPMKLTVAAGRVRRLVVPGASPTSVRCQKAVRVL